MSHIFLAIELNLESEGADAEHHEPLEQRLAEAPGGRLLAHDHRPQLAVVPHQDELLGPQHGGHHTLGLRSLQYSVQNWLSQYRCTELVFTVQTSVQNRLCLTCMLSSMRMLEKRILTSLGSPAPMQVQQMTSATSRSSFSHCFLSILYSITVQYRCTEMVITQLRLTCYQSTVQVCRTGYHSTVQVYRNGYHTVKVYSSYHISVQGYRWISSPG